MHQLRREIATDRAEPVYPILDRFHNNQRGTRRGLTSLRKGEASLFQPSDTHIFETMAGTRTTSANIGTVDMRNFTFLTRAWKSVLKNPDFGNKVFSSCNLNARANVGKSKRQQVRQEDDSTLQRNMVIGGANSQDQELSGELADLLVRVHVHVRVFVGKAAPGLCDAVYPVQQADHLDREALFDTDPITQLGRRLYERGNRAAPHAV
ncbi:hypothetical protein EG327_007270 [Venturia inaequalis]|uniref:Uncharacterized protein n=1 Tax=Venturia inaequalis TaxID=5025 RepID=A0A8H3Z2Z9_VENIN|nr:hypothetical protein EG327_007270 [Venturia inaequalis]